MNIIQHFFMQCNIFIRNKEKKQKLTVLSFFGIIIWGEIKMKNLPANADYYFLPRAQTAEESGLSSAVILKALQKLNKKNISWHSCMVIRNGIVAAECFRFPFAANQPHCMYSISKNITSIALGFAVTEGRISLDARIIDLFPDYDFGSDTEKMQKMTVRNLISMNSGKRPSYLLNKTDDDWLPHLFDAKWINKPGEKFEYVNENSYAVCAILQRVLGQSVVEYLEDRLWKPLGIRTPFWETDRKGIESGGWGINLSPESMAKIFVCVQNGGIFNGKQVIPAAWLQEATVSQQQDDIANGSQLKNGYGFSFWMRDENVYCGEGMYGQIAGVHRTNGMLVCMTGGETDIGAMWGSIMDILENAICEQAPDPIAQKQLKDFCNNNAFDSLCNSSIRSPMEKLLDKKYIYFKKHRLNDAVGFPFSIIPVPAVYMTKDRGGNVHTVKFEFKSDVCRFTWFEGNCMNTVECGMDGAYRYSDAFVCSRPYLFAGAAWWEDNYTLRVILRPMECLASRVLVFRFANGKVSMEPSMVPSSAMMVDNIAGFVKEMAKGKVMENLTDKALQKLQAMIEPLHHGKY